MIRRSLTVRAFAKINLTLDVFSKRSDGYHGIASVFQAISLCDSITLTERDEPGIGFHCVSNPTIDVPVDESNLVMRAAMEALNAAGRPNDAVRLDIKLQKLTPAKAGLGGGSSDAAATLMAMNSFCDLGLSSTELASVAASLGSDVPFFLVGGTASARGRGETVTSLPDIPRCWMVIAQPEATVSTAWAYGELDAIPDRPSHRATKRMEEAIRGGDWERLMAWQSNDFEAPIFAKIPAIAWMADELAMAGAITAHLCGSGSAVYGMAADERQARRIAGLLALRYKNVYVAHTLTRRESAHEIEIASARTNTNSL